MIPVIQTIVRLVNSLFLLFLIAVLAAFVVRALVKRLDPFGRPPVNRVLFILGKAANFGCWGVFVFFTVYSYVAPYDPFWPAAVLSSLCLVPSSLLIYFSFRHLGDCNRFGLPKGKTAIVRKGLYARSRNPMSLGFYLLSIASVLYVPRLWTVVPALAGIVIHHLIVLGEEKHMREACGAKWEEYAQAVRRYF
jgi:protein-S-isoprenylcysteine O-methyltransferase Ste14